MAPAIVAGPTLAAMLVVILPVTAVMSLPSVAVMIVIVIVLANAMQIVLVGMHIVTALAEDGSLWTNHDKSLWSGLVRTNQVEL
eukprot:SAG31_NODE_37516_length_303_cov_1.264706_1_plen_83_part_01